MQYVIICGEKTIHTYLLVYVENMSEKTQTHKYIHKIWEHWLPVKKLAGWLRIKNGIEASHCISICTSKCSAMEICYLFKKLSVSKIP